MKNYLSDICIYTRTYSGDAELIPYLYQSIAKFIPQAGDFVLVVEQRDYELIKKVTPSWVRIVQEETFAPGTIQHKYSKITADLHTDKKFIFHIDADSIFIKTPSEDELFCNGKPFLEYAPYETLYKYYDSQEFYDQMKKYALENGPIFLEAATYRYHGYLIKKV